MEIAAVTPCDVAFFFPTLCAETLLPPIFRAMPNLSKTLKVCLRYFFTHYFSAKFTEYYSIRVRVRVKGE